MRQTCEYCENFSNSFFGYGEECDGCEVTKDGTLTKFQLHKDLQDLVEVVRCKDCKHKLKNEHDDDYYCETMWIDFMVNGLTDNDYCSSGERRAK